MKSDAYDWSAARAFSRSMGALAAGLLLALCSGCGRFTPDNFAAVQVGEDRKADVVRKMGLPKLDGDTKWYYENRDKSQGALIFFGGEGVVEEKKWVKSPGWDPARMRPHTDPRDARLRD